MRETKKFLCSYFHDGSWWSVKIDAYDWNDAEMRVAKLGNMRLDGEHIMTIADGPGIGRLVKGLCAVRNFFWRPKP